MLALMATGASAEPLRLEDAIQLAMTRNERAAIADLDIVVADAAVAKARVAFLPVLQLSGNDTYRPGDTPKDVAQGTLTLNQPLFAPSAFPLYSEAKHSLASQRAQSADDRRTLAFDAAKAFFNVLLADQVVKAAKKKLDTAKADLADTDAQVKAQLVSSNDVTRAQIGVGTSQRELAANEGSLTTARVQLELVVASPVTGDLSAPTALLAESARPIPAVDTLVAHGLAARPDLVAHKEDALAAHDFAQEPRMRYLPTLGFSSQLNATSNTPASGHTVDGSLAVTASWTIFDAGSRSADARSRDAQATIADLQTKALTRSVDAQIRSAASALGAAQQALAAAQVAVDASRKSADEAEILYRQGLAKAIELIDANEQRFTAEVSYAEAQFDVATAYLALRQAMGLDPIGGQL